MPSPSPPATAIATARTPGFDVARAVAVLGMMLVNYEAMLGASERGPGWLVWLSQRYEGRSAALFVLLAGLGISLRSRRAREQGGRQVSFERGALLKRAVVLLGVGLLNLHLWFWDILHCYGLYLTIAVLLLTARSAVLWAVAVFFVAGGVGLQLWLDYSATLDLWSPLGMVADLLFNGLYPVFPWMAFLVVGMWLGRLDLRHTPTRHRVLAGGLAAAVLGEAAGVVRDRFAASGGPLASAAAPWLSSWPRPPTPAYVLAAGGTAVALICLCIALTQPRPGARWVVALAATGQLAFTLYVGHAIAVLVPLQHGLLEEASLAMSMVYAVAVYVAGVALSLWWRRRWTHGPLESLIHQITGRTEAAPWGGALITTVPRP